MLYDGSCVPLVAAKQKSPKVWVSGAAEVEVSTVHTHVPSY